MRILGLDLSTSTGWASLDTETNQLKYGCLTIPNTESLGEYPNNFVDAAYLMADKVCDIAKIEKPDVIVTEETNKGHNRFSQKILEMIHLAVLTKLRDINAPVPKYINTGEWRGKSLGLSVAKTKKLAKEPLKRLDQLKRNWSNKKNECKLADKTSKKQAKAIEKQAEKEYKDFKKELETKAIFGKIDRKSISVGFINVKWNLNFKKGDNDITDAICLIEAFLKGCKINSNYTVFGHEARDRKKNEQKQ